MDPSLFLTAILATIFIGLTLLLLVLAELRAQWRQREELNRLLIMALFRISKGEMRRADALEGAVLRAMREGRVDRVRVAEIERALEEDDGGAREVEAEAEEEQKDAAGRRSRDAGGGDE
jgi:hypothetical protein